MHDTVLATSRVDCSIAVYVTRHAFFLRLDKRGDHYISVDIHVSIDKVVFCNIFNGHFLRRIRIGKPELYSYRIVIVWV